MPEATPFDPADHLADVESQAELLDQALATGDAKVIVNALAIVARARGISAVSRDSGIGRSSIYKALAPDGNPTLETFVQLVGSLGIELHARAAA
ncbi:hypothetical protein S2M10_11870 [Sphingomonas sp. S2M10]|uniref:addiction module antidote protein n=1 Tax=Sphingomonas sp. S2M10 TaxID=2705010 RepID=UPI0014576DD7|nr:hypothetical protein [Sphingomonas sp. S2M10]